MCLLPLIENVLCLQLKMSGFVCLTIFLIGSEFKGAQTSHLQFSSDHKLHGVSSSGREFHVNRNFSEGERSAQDAGKAYRGQRRHIPIILALVLSALSTGILMFVKFILLKGAFLLKLTLILSGLMIALKISSGGMSSMLYLRDLYPIKNNQYPENEPDLSGYGYERDYMPNYGKPEYKPYPPH